MGDSKEIDRFSRAVAVLKQGIESVETYLEKVPAPALLQLHSIEDIPQSVREQIKKKLWRIFIYGEYPLATMWSNFDEPLLINSGWQFTYYDETYQPISKKIRELIDVSMAPERKTVEIAVVEECDFLASGTPGQTLASEIENYMDDYEYLALDDWVGNFVMRYIENCSADTDHPSSDLQNPILSCFKSVFTVMYDYQWQIEYEKGCQRIESEDIEGNGTTNVEEDVEDREKREAHNVDLSNLKESVGEDDEEKKKRKACEVDLSDFEKIIKKRYFKPDNWITNEEDLRPILIARKMSDIRPPIRQRIREIYDSYVFGNWVAVIALSRCLLEYALDENGPFHGIRVHLTPDEASQKNLSKNKNWSRDLREVIDEASTTFPTLAHSMETIKLAGNKVMHPPATQKGVFGHLAKWRTQNKEDAQECLTHIIKITTTLYSENPPPPKPTPPLKPSPK